MEASIRQCDKCKKEIRSDKDPEKYKDFVNVYLGLYDVGSSYGYSERETATHRVNVRQLLLCGDCLTKIGIVKKEPTAESKVQAPSDMLYDMVYNIMQNIDSQRQA